MLYLDKAKLEVVLSSRGTSINKLAGACGISRQSIYNMFENTVFNSSFDKIRRYLNVDYGAITSNISLANEVMKTAPDRITMVAHKLTEFVERYQADLLLFGSNDVGKYGPRPDWNFAVFFPDREKDKELRIIRQELSDQAAPYHINIINLNRAPLWLKLVIKERFVRLFGNTGDDLLFSKGIWNKEINR